MWELHQWATQYSQDPAVLLGIDPIRESWQAWQIRRAVHTWGTWFQAQRDATRQVPVPKGKRDPMMSVPRYSEDQLAAMLGIGPEQIDAETRRRVDLLAQQLLAGTVDWSQWEA